MDKSLGGSPSSTIAMKAPKTKASALQPLATGSQASIRPQTRQQRSLSGRQRSVVATSFPQLRCLCYSAVRELPISPALPLGRAGALHAIDAAASNTWSRAIHHSVAVRLGSPSWPAPLSCSSSPTQHEHVAAGQPRVLRHDARRVLRGVAFVQCYEKVTKTAEPRDPEGMHDKFRHGHR